MSIRADCGFKEKDNYTFVVVLLSFQLQPSLVVTQKH